MFIKRIHTAIKVIVQNGSEISFRAVARQLKVDAHKILDNEKYKQVVTEAITKQTKQKDKSIKKAINELIKEGQKISYFKIHRKMGLPRSFIETKKRKAIINSYC